MRKASFFSLIIIIISTRFVFATPDTKLTFSENYRSQDNDPSWQGKLQSTASAEKFESGSSRIIFIGTEHVASYPQNHPKRNEVIDKLNEFILSQKPGAVIIEGGPPSS